MHHIVKPLIAVAFFSAQPLMAAEDEEKYYYFHKSGIDSETFIKDFEFCSEYAARVEPPAKGYSYTPNPAAAAASGFMQGLIKGGERRMMYHAVIRKCMGLKSYKRYSIDKDRLEQLWDGGWDEAKGRVATLAAGPVPTDQELPQ